MGYVTSSQYPDWAGDRECGTEARAIKVAKQLGIKSFNSYNDAKAVNAECKKQNEKNKKPTVTQQPKPEPKNPSQDFLNDYVGKNADGQGMTAAEFDLYAKEKLLGLEASLEAQKNKQLGAQSLALQNLLNDASKYAVDADLAKSNYAEDASSYRTVYQTDAM